MQEQEIIKKIKDCIYISAPMSIYNDLNRNLFLEIEKKLRDNGKKHIINPYTTSIINKRHHYFDFIKDDITGLKNCESIIFGDLCNLKYSTGCKIEFLLSINNKIDIYVYNENKEIEKGMYNYHIKTLYKKII